MQEIFNFLITLPARFAYMFLDLINSILNLIPNPSIDLQAYINSLPVEALQLLGYVHMWTAIGMISAAYATRGILMIFGR